jgi:segregation and condensation protein B
MNRAVRLAKLYSDADEPVSGGKTKLRHRAKTESRMTKGKTELHPVPAPEAEAGEGEATNRAVDPTHLRIVEALLFAASEPLAATVLSSALPTGADVNALLASLREAYAERGVNLVNVANKWQFRTATDLSFLLHKEKLEERRLSRAAIETLAIIAYHQPVTRAEIEDIRGVMVSKGTVDSLMELGWVRIRGRRRTPGRPVTYGTTEAMLVHFGLENVSDLPGIEELKAAGFLDAAPPSGFDVPNPSDALAPDEDPYIEGEELLPEDAYEDVPPGEDA